MSCITKDDSKFYPQILLEEVNAKQRINACRVASKKMWDRCLSEDEKTNFY